MKYLDTVVEDTDRIKKGRKNINIGITLLLICFTITSLLSFCLYYIGFIITGIYFIALAVCYFILMASLIIKREIYSIAIILKEKK